MSQCLPGILRDNAVLVYFLYGAAMRGTKSSGRCDGAAAGMRPRNDRRGGTGGRRGGRRSPCAPEDPKTAGGETPWAHYFFDQGKRRVTMVPMTAKTLDIEASLGALQGNDPAEVLRFAYEQLDNVAISFSGAEDVVLIDIASRIRPRPQVFSLDTGRLHIETYRFLEKVRKHYDLELEVLSPDAADLEEFVKSKGLYSFYEDGHGECCGVRKIAPLRRRLATLDGWITGQRKDQSPTRTNVQLMEADQGFSTAEHQLYKFNPLADWSSERVWMYIRENGLPYNELHDKGYISIGCEPCTRPVLPNQHEREGRWWWEEATQKECGLHAGNIDK